MIKIDELESELNAMILSGQFAEAFEKFYAENVIVQENDLPPRVGKEANRQHEKRFYDSVKDFHGVTIGNVAVKDSITFSE